MEQTLLWRLWGSAAWQPERWASVPRRCGAPELNAQSLRIGLTFLQVLWSHPELGPVGRLVGGGQMAPKWAKWPNDHRQRARGVAFSSPSLKVSCNMLKLLVGSIAAHVCDSVRRALTSFPMVRAGFRVGLEPVASKVMSSKTKVSFAQQIPSASACLYYW